MQTYDCLVLGGGISGLSAAWALHQRGATLLVVEKQPVVGGALSSECTDDGFVLEHGTQTVSSNDPALWQHFDDLGVAGDRLVTAVQRTYIAHQGQLEPLPQSAPELLASRLLSPLAKARLLAEPLLPRAVTPDESVATFFNRRLGPELTRMVVGPFVSGIYGGDPNDLSIRSVFPGLWEMEQRYGSLFWGLLASNKPESTATHGPSGPSPRETFSFSEGLATWPRAIARQLGPEQVWVNTTATHIEPADQNWHVTVVRDGKEEVLAATRVILSVPANVAAELVLHLEPLAGQMLRTTTLPPMAAVHLGYRREAVSHALDGMGMLCPRQGDCHTMGTLWMSTIFPLRAPDGMVLLTGFVGGAGTPALAQQDSESLIDLVQREQRSLLGIRDAPVLARVAYWPHSIPQYDANQERRLQACNRLQARWPGLYLLSNYRSGFSVESCWQKGTELGNHIVLPNLTQQAVASV